MLMELGAFAGGVMDGNDLVVGTQSKQTDGHLQILSGAIGGGFFGRFLGDSAASDGVNIRIYLRGFKGNNNPVWLTPGHEFWRTYSVRQPSGASYQGGFYSADNLHQSSDYGVTGPAIVNEGPANGTNQPWSTVLRGANNRGLSADGFNQTNLGLPKSFGTNFAWAGGNHNVIANEWITFLRGEFLDYNGNGWVEMWARWPGLTDWRNIIPRITGRYTSYNNWNYPVCGCYVPASQVGGAQAQIDIAHGAYTDNMTESLNYANVQNGYTGGGGGGGGGGTVPGGTQVIGHNSVGTGGTVGDLPDYKRGNDYTAPYEGKIPTMYEYIGGGNATLTKKALVYVADNTGVFNLVDSSNEITILATDAATWRQYDFSTQPVIHAGQRVRLATHCSAPPGGGGNTTYDVQTGSLAVKYDLYSDGPSSVWTAAPGPASGTDLTGTYDNLLSLFGVFLPVSDTIAPTITQMSGSGSTITLDTNESIDTTAPPATTAFTVKVNALVRPVASIALMSTHIVLTLPSTLLPADIVTVAYTAPGANPIKDTSGNNMASFNDTVIINATPTIKRVHVIGGRLRIAGARVSSPSSRISGRGGGGL